MLCLPTLADAAPCNSRSVATSAGTSRCAIASRCATTTTTVIAALPTAQNIFVIASRYERSTVLARDAIFASTILSVPAVAIVAALLA